MASQISSLLQSITKAGQTFTANGAEVARQALLREARQLVSSLESPAERIARISSHEPFVFASIRVGIDIKLWDALISSADKSSSAAALAAATGTDVEWLKRILKHLATADMITETGPDEYAPNAITKLLTEKPAQGMVINTFDGMAVNLGTWPQYCKDRHYKNNTDKEDSPFSAVTGSHYFKWIHQPGREKDLEAFHGHMQFKTLGPKWFDQVDVHSLLSGLKTDKDAVLMVDVGGDTGIDSKRFHDAYPDIPGKLILQDLPGSIEKLDTAAIAPVEAMAHDFFTPEPIKGAKAYYLKMVLHDWPDASCREILSNLKPALEPGYSKILINEIVIPDQGADWFSTSVDLIMMLFHSAQERREFQWRELIESVGLKLVKIHACGASPEKLIEVELP